MYVQRPGGRHHIAKKAVRVSETMGHVFYYYIFLNCIVYVSMYVCVCTSMCLCVCTLACVWREENNFRSRVSSAMWVLGIELRPSAYVASSFTG